MTLLTTLVAGLGFGFLRTVPRDMSFETAWIKVKI